jgi:phosphate/phosphite/phosphonate ABC transporter binding protein
MKICHSFFLMRYLLIIGLFLTYGCENNSQQQIDVNFSETANNSQDSANYLVDRTLKVAVSTMTSPKETFNQYQALLHYLGDKLSISIEFKQRKTYKEVNDLLQEGRLDLAFVCSGAYVDARDRFPLEILAVPVINGEAKYYAYIIVNKDTPYHKFTDLQGKRFAFTDPLSNTGYFYPLNILDSLKAKPDTFFASTMFTYGHDLSIHAIARNLVDGASIDGLIFDYLKKFQPDEVKNIRIIKKSEGFGIPPVVVPGSLPDSIKIELKDILLSMHQDTLGAEILKSLRIDKFSIGNPDDYSSIRKIE